MKRKRRSGGSCWKTFLQPRIVPIPWRDVGLAVRHGASLRRDCQLRGGTVSETRLLYPKHMQVQKKSQVSLPCPDGTAPRLDVVCPSSHHLPFFSDSRLWSSGGGSRDYTSARCSALGLKGGGECSWLTGLSLGTGHVLPLPGVCTHILTHTHALTHTHTSYGATGYCFSSAVDDAALCLSLLGISGYTQAYLGIWESGNDL